MGRTDLGEYVLDGVDQAETLADAEQLAARCDLADLLCRSLERQGAANYSLIMGLFMFSGAAALIRNFGTDAQKEKYMTRLYAGDWAGTMCLTEPGAGSDVGAL